MCPTAPTTLTWPTLSDHHEIRPRGLFAWVEGSVLGCVVKELAWQGFVWQTVLKMQILAACW